VVAVAEIGFAVALGVILDTIVVRSILVTALNLDFGRHLWWPGKLSTKPAERPRPEEPAHGGDPSSGVVEVGQVAGVGYLGE